MDVGLTQQGHGRLFATGMRPTRDGRRGVAGGVLVRSGVAPREKKWRRVWPCWRRVRLEGEGIDANRVEKSRFQD